MKKLLLIAALTCLGMQVAHAYPGSYYQTCRRCYTRGNILYCKCQKANGGWRWTNLQRPGRCNRIKNQNGTLTCFGGHPRPEPRPRPQHKKNPAKKLRKDVRNGNWAPSDLMG